MVAVTVTAVITATTAITLGQRWLAQICFYPITHHWPLAKSYLLKMPERWLIIFSCYLLGRFQKEDIWVSMFETCKELYYKYMCCYW